MQGDNLFQLLGTRYAPNSATYMLMAALVMIPTVWLPDLKALSALGIVGVAATLTVTAAIAYTLISGIPSNRPLSLNMAPEVFNPSFLRCHVASSTPA